MPAGESNYTVFLKSYNSANNTISAKSSQYVVTSRASFNPNKLCTDEIPAVTEKDKDDEEGDGGKSVAPPIPTASAVPGIIQVRVDSFFFVNDNIV